MLLVANSCHYNENFKNGKHRLQTNARPSGAAPTNPRPSGQKLGCKSPRVGQMFGANPQRCARGGGRRRRGEWLWVKLLLALAIVEAIASLRSIILRRIYILTSSVLLFPMTPHEKNTRVMLSPSQRSYDCFLSVEASLLVHAEKCGRGKAFGMPSNRIDTEVGL